LEKIAQDPPDLVLLGAAFKGGTSGLEAADTIRSRWRIPVVFTGVDARINQPERTASAYWFGCLPKSFHDRELEAVIEAALYIAKVEEKLKESEDKYRNIFEQSRDAIYITSPGGEPVSFNQATLDLFGLTLEGLP